MGRPRTRPLPEGIYERRYAKGRIVYWYSLELGGERVREYGGDTIGEAIAARRVAYVVDALYREPSRRSAQVHAVSAVAGVAQCIASYDDSVLALEEVRAAALHVSAAEAYARVVSACDAEVS